MKKYKNFNIFGNRIKAVEQFYILIKKPFSCEKFGLKNQFSGAVVSITCTIAEACNRNYNGFFMLRGDPINRYM